MHAIWPHSICRSSICGQFVLLIEQLSMHQSARHHDFLHLRKAGLSMVLGLKSGNSTFCEREQTPLFLPLISSLKISTLYVAYFVEAWLHLLFFSYYFFLLFARAKRNESNISLSTWALFVVWKPLM